MKKPNIYQMRKHSSHVKHHLQSLACARVAIGELVALGFTPVSFRLGNRAAITVQVPHHAGLLAFEPISIGFTGDFHTTTFGAVFAGFSVEFHGRRVIASSAIHSRVTRAARSVWY